MNKKKLKVKCKSSYRLSNTIKFEVDFQYEFEHENIYDEEFYTCDTNGFKVMIVAHRFFQFFELINVEQTEISFGDTLINNHDINNKECLEIVKEIKHHSKCLADIINKVSESNEVCILNKDYGLINSALFLGAINSISNTSMSLTKFVNLSYKDK